MGETGKLKKGSDLFYKIINYMNLILYFKNCYLCTPKLFLLTPGLQDYLDVC